MKIYANIREIADEFDYFILDLWGLLHDGVKAYPGAVNCLESLKKAGKTCVPVSNSFYRSHNVRDCNLAPKGFAPRNFAGLLTAGEVALQTLNRDYDRQMGFLLGDPEDHTDLTNAVNVHWTSSPDEAEFVLAAQTQDHYTLTHDEYEWLRHLAHRNLPMICANPDLSVNQGTGHVVLCAGTLAQEYEKLGGQVTYCGKPYPEIYEQAHELMGRPDKNRMVALGDSLRTDIAGANGFGIAGIFNTTGMHREELHMGNIAEADPEKLAAHIGQAPEEHKPYGIISGFLWD